MLPRLCWYGDVYESRLYHLSQYVLYHLLPFAYFLFNQWALSKVALGVVGSEMCIRGRILGVFFFLPEGLLTLWNSTPRSEGSQCFIHVLSLKNIRRCRGIYESNFQWHRKNTKNKQRHRRHHNINVKNSHTTINKSDVYH